MAHLGRDIDQQLRKLFSDELVKLLKALAAKLDLDAEEIRKALKKFEDTDAAHILPGLHTDVPAKPSPNGDGWRSQPRDADGRFAKKPNTDAPKFPAPDDAGPQLNEHGDLIRQRWTPAHDVGPLGEEWPADTFRTNSYNETELGGDTTFFRSVTEHGKKDGGFWTRERPTGPLQVQLDSALLPEWQRTKHGNGLVTEEQATHYVEAVVPKGTVIHEGPAGPQVGDVFPETSLDGGGPQVYIPKFEPDWVIPESMKPLAP